MAPKRLSSLSGGYDIGKLDCCEHAIDRRRQFGASQKFLNAFRDQLNINGGE